MAQRFNVSALLFENDVSWKNIEKIYGNNVSTKDIVNLSISDDGEVSSFEIDPYLCRDSSNVQKFAAIASSEDSNNDDENDKNFELPVHLKQISSESDSYSISDEKNNTSHPEKSTNKILESKNQRKKITLCKFCQNDFMSRNFVRHMQTFHGEEKEVIKLLQYPKNSKARRAAFKLLRNETNFDLYIQGDIRPTRSLTETQTSNFYPSIYCRGLYKKSYLKRHNRICKQKNRGGSSSNYVSESQTLTACVMDPTNVVSKLIVKEQVFDKMKGDDIAFEAKKDLLIVNFGNSYLKNIRERYILRPKNFDAILSAARVLCGYNSIKKIISSPSIALHLGTYLKLCCNELLHLILKEAPGFTCTTKDECKNCQRDIHNLRTLLENRWSLEIASLANKDIQEKKMENAKARTTSLVILFNTRRIGDVQYLKIQQYSSERKTDFSDFENVLTEGEKAITREYKRIVCSGKGSRAVVILLPKMLQGFIETLIKHRHKYIATIMTMCLQFQAVR
ncbi:uncharacterized protein LOC126893092 [Diabrotica virgifera virgifera]|uniref:C2H2-type domain-containing protein n=1 Tax=Diabrotica virgifera virgifera TaxID=50390 RepID=A0ABM5L985_DIAVI|nr:uncharacterized protein LOC126893092 [Diabrotica virgifera virgifera]